MSLGISVMLNMLAGGNEGIAAMFRAAGKVIVKAEMSGADLVLSFDDGTGLRLLDDGQSCCESRYMTCDDDLSKFLGAKFINAEEREGGSTEDEYGTCHEQSFLVVTTSLGAFTVCTHNEHNGYYGGFSLKAEEVSR